MLLTEKRDYQASGECHAYDLPDFFNIGSAILSAPKRTGATGTAIVHIDENGERCEVSWDELNALSDRFAKIFTGLGIGQGDRVALVLPQTPHTAAAHFGLFLIGAISLPIPVVFGMDGLSYRFNDAGVCAVVTLSANLEKVLAAKASAPGVRAVISIDGGKGARALDDFSPNDLADYMPVSSRADDPALLLYTSGTTGKPKGALHAHRILLGHLPGYSLAQEWAWRREPLMMWTPSDWAWAGGLMNIMLPSLYLGLPVVAWQYKRFDADEAWDLLASEPITGAFIPPTALKMMRANKPGARAASITLRNVMSGGEAVGDLLKEWLNEELVCGGENGIEEHNIHLNEIYGQTECNLIVGSCRQTGTERAGTTGKPTPCSTLAIIDEKGNRQPTGTAGIIAVKRPHASMFLEYWKRPEATREKFIGDWMTTGDQGVMDDDGFIAFVGRDDDIITSSGYRIGPGEIEDCLLSHPAVQLAAVVGKPDPLRTEIVVAFVVPEPEFSAGPDLAADIQTHVRQRLSAHEYPREVIFTSALPLTTTGKIIRRDLREQL